MATTKPEPMSEDDLRALVDSEMRQSIGYASGKMAAMRMKAQWYFWGEAKGDLAPPEIEGRSSVVVPVVRNTIESMLPQLMVKFAGSDQVVSFEPNKEGDEEKAEQATDYITYLYNVQNDGERKTYTALKDALLSKKGILKVWWDTSAEVTEENYRGIDQIELAQVMDDDEVQITSQESYPDEEDAEQRQQYMQQMQGQLQQALQAAQQGNPQAQQAVQQMQQAMARIEAQPPKMIYNISCKRTKKGGKLCVDNVPPEEFLISRDAKTIADARFIGHRVARTLSDLRSMGYKNVDNLGNDDMGSSFNLERVERMSWDDELAYAGLESVDSAGDQSQKLVWVTEAYIRCDYDGKGISQLRKVVRAGTEILENEVVDMAPFIDLDPIPMPHKFYGMSVADLAMEGQRTETSLLRTTLDNGYLQTNGRYFAVEGQANLDDLLSSRPGGVVRIKTPGAVGRLDQGMGDLQTTMGLMEYMKGYNEDSTGWTRYNQGSDGDSLNQTATGMNIVTNRADMRLDLMARNLARGFSDLFKMMLKLVCQYQDKEAVIKLRGKWVAVDPREWTNGFSVTINVGLGTGNRDQQIKQLMALLMEQKQGMQIGIATPENIYNSEVELVKALGFKSADKFWTDPAKSPPPQHQDPALIKIQADQQAKSAEMQQELQLEREKMQLKVQSDQAEQSFQAQQVMQQQQLEAQRTEREMQVKAQLEMQKSQFENAARQQQLDFDRWKAQLEAETQIYIAQLSGGGADGTNIGSGDITAALAQAIDGFRTSMEGVVAQLSKPKQIVRDQNGRALGIQ